MHSWSFRLNAIFTFTVSALGALSALNILSVSSHIPRPRTPVTPLPSRPPLCRGIPRSPPCAMVLPEDCMPSNVLTHPRSPPRSYSLIPAQSPPSTMSSCSACQGLGKTRPPSLSLPLYLSNSLPLSLSPSLQHPFLPLTTTTLLR